MWDSTPGERGRDRRRPAVTILLVGPVSGAHLNPVALPAVSVSHTDRSSGYLWLVEVLATAGLVALIFALVRSGRAVSVGHLRRHRPRIRAWLQPRAAGWRRYQRPSTSEVRFDEEVGVSGGEVGGVKSPARRGPGEA